MDGLYSDQIMRFGLDWILMDGEFCLQFNFYFIFYLWSVMVDLVLALLPILEILVNLLTQPSVKRNEILDYVC